MKALRQQKAQSPTETLIAPNPQFFPFRGRRVPYAELAVDVLERVSLALTTNEIVQELGRNGYIPLDEVDQLQGAVYSSIAHCKHAIKRVDGCWDLVGCHDVLPKSATSDQPPLERFVI